MASTRTENAIDGDEHRSLGADAFVHYVLLGDLSIKFVSHSELFNGWLTSYYQASQSVHDSTGYEICVEAIGSGHEFLIEPPADSVFTKFCLIADAHCYFANGKFYSTSGGENEHHIELDVLNRTVKANLGGMFLRSEESFIYVVIRDILRRLVLPLNGLVMLHGSVVTRDNQTIFFAGDKGMGKSTIALELMCHGYRIMSDDSPLAAITTHGAEVFSGRDQLSVTDNTLKLFPELNEFISKQRDVSGKFFLDRTRMSSQRIDSDPSRITDFVVLKRASTGTLALNKTDKALATAEFIREFMPLFRKEIQLEQDPARFKKINAAMFQTLGALLSHADTYELSYCNEDREKIPQLLKSLTTQGAS